MAELVFNIRNIFNSSTTEGCLYQYDGSEKYHIPAYQRGYKWASEKETDAIPVLLSDLRDAFNSAKNSNRKEYYMQYITVKKNKNKYLEVIDGQQRLTSFSILLSVLHLMLNDELNYAKDKLEYAIRDDFFKDYIYDKNKLQVFVDSPWDKENGIVLNGISINKQDIYYLHSASKKIKNFLSADSINAELEAFLTFILDFVKIIVNEIEPHIDSERVFRNLNSNKIPLTEAELIKGLFLTKIARSTNEQDQQKHFKEIIELRASLGRQWDEITTWVNDKKVKHFFFSINNNFYSETSFNNFITEQFKKTNSPISEEKALLLLLLSMTFSKDLEVKESKYLLFNYFHKQTKNVATSNSLFTKLKEIYGVIKDWYQNDKTFNLIGFVFFAKGSNQNKINFIEKNLSLSKDILLDDLITLRNSLVPDNLSILKYGDSDDEIHRVLLSLSLFDVLDEFTSSRFDFYNFTKNKWSLEHIFPQSPEGKWRGEIHILTTEEKEEIKKILGSNKTVEIENILNKPERSDEEKEVYYDALQKSGINSLGNMSLLSVPDNSSNGCAMFALKRDNVNMMIRNGSFVPKHTFEIFNKIKIASTSILNWSKEDVDEHFKHIEETIKVLKLKGK